MLGQYNDVVALEDLKLAGFDRSGHDLAPPGPVGCISRLRAQSTIAARHVAPVIAMTIKRCRTNCKIILGSKEYSIHLVYG
jgi:hypothetical protein